MAKVTQSGGFDGQVRKIRLGVQIGMRDLTLLTKAMIQRENPVDTGLSRTRWAHRMVRGGLTGIVGNNVKYIQVVAEGRPGKLSRKQKRNIGFHQRGARKAILRTSEFLERGLRQAGVQLQ